MGVLIRPLARWAVAGLIVVTVEAIGAHLRIGSPVTTITAVLYTVAQVSFGINSLTPLTGEVYWTVSIQPVAGMSIMGRREHGNLL